MKPIMLKRTTRHFLGIMAFTLQIGSGHGPLLTTSSANADDSFGGALGQPLAKSSNSTKNYACSPPDTLSSSMEETAWRLWIAATCPVNRNQYPFVVWETWIEQAQMYPPDPENGLLVPNSLAKATNDPRALHHSPLTLSQDPTLAATVPGLLGAPDQNCNKAGNPPPDQPNLILCEEVRLNGATEDYIAGNTLWNRPGQRQVAASGGKIQFPPPSVEIKADWIQLSSIGLDCNNLPPGFTESIHVETINGHCFALAGMHLISKLTPNWIWATFEAQNLTTNPNRCVVLGCRDAFGSNPPSTKGGPGGNTQLTPQLAKLMTEANLAPEWRNYRLDGVQVLFARGGQPTLLGNSIIEGENANVPLEQSSCISCHAASSINKNGTDGITLLKSNPIGLPQPLPSSDWIRRDFVWSLSTACPNSPFQTCK
jgi:hypothetical protein